MIVTTSSSDKAVRLKEFGADVVINYTDQPEWGKAVREATGGRGADLVVETFGADTIEQSMRAVGVTIRKLVFSPRPNVRVRVEQARRVEA